MPEPIFADSMWMVVSYFIILAGWAFLTTVFFKKVRKKGWEDAITVTVMMTSTLLVIAMLSYLAAFLIHDNRMVEYNKVARCEDYLEWARGPSSITE